MERVAEVRAVERPGESVVFFEVLLLRLLKAVETMNHTG